MVSIKLQDKKFLKILLIALVLFLVFIILTKTKKDEEEVYDLKNIIMDMNKEKLGKKSFNGIEYNLEQIRDTYKDLYYFYEPLNQNEILNELESIITYELKVIDIIHESANIESINGYNFSLNEDSCFNSLFKSNQEFLYNELMKDPNYQRYLWDIDNEQNPPLKWYFNKMGNEISWVVKKDIDEYLTNQIYIENYNFLDEEMYVRIFKFETWMASKARLSCGLLPTPDIKYD